MKMMIIFLLYLLPFVLSQQSCSVNITQQLRETFNGKDGALAAFDVLLENESPSSLLQVLLLPSTPLTQVDGMKVSIEGLSLEVDVLSKMTHSWSYTKVGLAPADFKVLSAVCDSMSLRSNHKHDKPTHAPSPAATHKPTSTPKATTAPTTAPAAPATPISNSSINQAMNYPPSPLQTEQYFGNADPSGFCTGSPKMFQGKPCASTTRYWDGTMAACGCGANNAAFPWVGTQYTAAGSPPIYGYGTTWCSGGCGKCYQLTTTGYSPDGKGATPGQTITVMVTNLCPPQAPWCSNGLNGFSYQGHFDLADTPTNGLITALGWDNPEVVYEEVACTGAETPTPQEYAECQCASSA